MSPRLLPTASLKPEDLAGLRVLVIDDNMNTLRMVSDVLRAAGVGIPVIIVSAYDDPETKQQARAAGANDYVTKPPDFEKLKQRIEALLTAQPA